MRVPAVRVKPAGTVSAVHDNAIHGSVKKFEEAKTDFSGPQSQYRHYGHDFNRFRAADPDQREHLSEGGFQAVLPQTGKRGSSGDCEAAPSGIHTVFGSEDLDRARAENDRESGNIPIDN